jgi:hypothetical protein
MKQRLNKKTELYQSFDLDKQTEKSLSLLEGLEISINFVIPSLNLRQGTI